MISHMWPENSIQNDLIAQRRSIWTTKFMGKSMICNQSISMTDPYQREQYNTFMFYMEYLLYML